MIARRIVNRSNVSFSQNIAKLAVRRDLPMIHARLASTEKLTTSSAQSILASQRLQRPVSPHLGAYKMDQTWFSASAWQRITGAGLSGALYVYATAYLAAPLVGWHLESASIAAAVASLPLAAKGGIKFLIAWPFVYHGFNGAKHLVNDLAIGYAKKTIIRWNWAVWGASIVGALGLVAFL